MSWVIKFSNDTEWHLFYWIKNNFAFLLLIVWNKVIRRSNFDCSKMQREIMFNFLIILSFEVLSTTFQTILIRTIKRSVRFISNNWNFNNRLMRVVEWRIINYFLFCFVLFCFWSEKVTFYYFDSKTILLCDET